MTALYGLAYLATIPGAYFVHFEATGTSNSGIAFVRFLSTSFALPGEYKRPVQPGEGGIVPPRGEGCGCENEPRYYSYAFYVGATLPQTPFSTVAKSGPVSGSRRHTISRFGAVAGPSACILGAISLATRRAGRTFSLTHLSAEIEISPWMQLCPRPSLAHRGGQLSGRIRPHEWRIQCRRRSRSMSESSHELRVALRLSIRQTAYPVTIPRCRSDCGGTSRHSG